MRVVSLTCHIISTKYYHITSNSMGVMACTRFLLQGRQLHNEESESCISCTQHTYWSSFLPNIIKIYLRVSKWHAQDLCFRGDNYTMNKVRVVSVKCDKPTGPPLHPYQILSNYLKQYGSYGLHKSSASGEITM